MLLAINHHQANILFRTPLKRGYKEKSGGHLASIFNAVATFLGIKDAYANSEYRFLGLWNLGNNLGEGFSGCLLQSGARFYNVGRWINFYKQRFQAAYRAA